MLTPNMYIESDEKDQPDTVAVGATFAPSFGEPELDVSQWYQEIVDDEIPEMLQVNGSDYHFIFIIDRSGSMEGENIEMARKALKLFMQSLPVGCKFSIISFGDRFEMHKNFGEEENSTGVYSYSDAILESTLKAIDNFGADFGGTELDTPI